MPLHPSIGLVYLACPYGHVRRSVRNSRYRLVNKIAARLMERGFVVFSPLSHSHPIHTAGGFGDDKHNAWMALDIPLLMCCKAVIVVVTEGWLQSKGVRQELKMAKEWNIPVHAVAEDGTFLEIKALQDLLEPL